MDKDIAYIEYIREITWRKLVLDETQDTEVTILDIGCGPGDSWLMFKGHVIATDVTFDESTIFKAKDLDVDLILCDAHHLPVKNESLDIALCQEVLEHLSNPFTALKEMHRVLRRNGRLIVDVPCQLDKVTTPAILPIVKLLEYGAKVTMSKEISVDKPRGVKPLHTDLGIIQRFSSSLDSLPTNLIKLISKRILHLILTVRYCMNEHVNRWAWSWVGVIVYEGFVIKTVRPCVMIYPLAIFTKKYSILVPIEERLGKISLLKYWGQLICVVAVRL